MLADYVYVSEQGRLAGELQIVAMAGHIEVT